MCVPDLSPRLAKGAFFPEIAFRASAEVLPFTFAGSEAGPTMMKSLYMTSRRSLPFFSFMKAASASGSCTSSTSTSPFLPYCRALPVPTATHWSSMPVSFWNRGAR